MFTASTAKLQHMLTMAERFYRALMPVMTLAKLSGYTKKTTDGDEL